MLNKPERKILIVPNEDGFGPSSLVSYIVKALLHSRELECSISIWNQSRLDYNRSLYQDYLSEGRITFLPIWNIIQLKKDDKGEVSVPGTLEKMGGYREASDHYPEGFTSGSFDLVLDFGVPAAVRWAVNNRIESISVFDHAWGKTLRMIFDDLYSCNKKQRRLLAIHHGEWENLVAEISEDEGLTQRLFVFPPFITPDIFYNYWRSERRVSVWDIGAVLGGRPKQTADEARRFLQLDRAGDAILIQGGDTPVWDHALRNLVPDFVAAEKELDKMELNIVVNIPDRLMSDPEIKAALERQRLNRVRRLGFVPGGTIQEILPAFDFMVTRAGGGSVNDAVACRVPFVCVREPTQSQVEEILRSCVERGLTRAIEPEDFEQKPREVILQQYKMIAENRDIVTEMRDIPCQGEQAVAQAVLALLRLG
jgi:hypothetical protein